MPDRRDPLIGARLRGFEVLDRLGDELGSSVYRARSSDRRAELRVLHPPPPSGERLQALRGQAALAMRLQHPNLIATLGFGVLPDGRPYVLNEWIDGVPLSVDLQRGPLEPARAAEVAAQIAAALAAAHGSGLVLPDLHPSTVLLSDGGGSRVRVRGFELGLLVGEPVETRPRNARAIEAQLLGIAARHPREPARLRCPRCGLCYRPPSNSDPRCSLDGERLERTAEDPLIGRVVGHYRIVAPIASGGMGIVYRARHTSRPFEVAIKVLFGDFAADHNAVARFRREAEAANLIRHPNVAQVLEYGTSSEGITFMAMELLRGRTLAAALRDSGPFSVQRAAAIGRQVAAGLEGAHACGFVHRDLKPSNVMLLGALGDEQAKVLDFGLVRMSGGFGEEVTRLTQSGVIFGTPQYMAPEQIEGKVVGPAADLYALGVVLYELVAGRLPFEGSPMVLIARHLRDPAPPLPPAFGLERLVAQLLEKDPARRPDNAAAVARELGRIASTDSGPALSVSAFARAETRALRPKSPWTAPRDSSPPSAPPSVPPPRSQKTRRLATFGAIAAVGLLALGLRALEPVTIEPEPEVRAPEPPVASVVATTASVPDSPTDEARAIAPGSTEPTSAGASAPEASPLPVGSIPEPTVALVLALAPELAPASVPSAVEPIRLRCIADGAPGCVVLVDFEGGTARLQVDTAADITMLSSSAAERVGLRPDANSPLISVQTFAGSRVKAQLLRGTVAVAGAREEDVLILVAPGRVGRVDGVLGTSFLERFRATVGGGELRLVPLDAHDTPRPGGHGRSWWSQRFRSNQARLDRLSQLVSGAREAERRISAEIDPFALPYEETVRRYRIFAESAQQDLLAMAGRYDVPPDWRR
jgi:serine/threonine-protein kinase